MKITRLWDKTMFSLCPYHFLASALCVWIEQDSTIVCCIIKFKLLTLCHTEKDEENTCKNKVSMLEMSAQEVQFSNKQWSKCGRHHKYNGGIHCRILTHVSLLSFQSTMHNSVTNEASNFYHSSCIFAHKIPVVLSTQCGLHDSAGKSVTVGDSQSSRRSASGSSIASKASAPNDTDLCLAKQTPFLHWQIRTFAVCVLPEPCRSLTSIGTLYTPVGSSLICFNTADVSEEETHVKKNVSTVLGLF